MTSKTDYVSGDGVTATQLNLVGSETNTNTASILKLQQDQLVAEGSGSTTETSMTDIVTKTEDSAADDENAVYVVWAIGKRTNSGTGITIPRVNVDDGTNNFNIDPGSFDTDVYRGFTAKIYKDPSSATTALIEKTYWRSGSSAPLVALGTATVVAGFMATVKTFKLQAQAANGGTSYTRFKVWRLD